MEEIKPVTDTVAVESQNPVQQPNKPKKALPKALVIKIVVGVVALLVIGAGSVMASETLRNQIADMIEPKGSLVVNAGDNTQIPNMDIYLNATYQGKAPLTITRLKAGNYTLKFVTSGYKPGYKDVVIEAKKTTTVTVNLEINGVYQDQGNQYNVELEQDTAITSPLSTPISQPVLPVTPPVAVVPPVSTNPDFCSSNNTWQVSDIGASPNGLPAFKLSFPCSWRLDASDTPGAPDVSVSTTGVSIQIQRGDMGGTQCIFAGDANPNAAPVVNNFKELTIGSTTWRRVSYAAGTQLWRVCEKQTGNSGTHYYLPTSIGNIQITITDASLLSTVDNILSRIEVTPAAAIDSGLQHYIDSFKPDAVLTNVHRFSIQYPSTWQIKESHHAADANGPFTYNLMLTKGKSFIAIDQGPGASVGCLYPGDLPHPNLDNYSYFGTYKQFRQSQNSTWRRAGLPDNPNSTQVVCENSTEFNFDGGYTDTTIVGAIHVSGASAADWTEIDTILSTIGILPN